MHLKIISQAIDTIDTNILILIRLFNDNIQSALVVTRTNINFVIQIVRQNVRLFPKNVKKW